MPPKLPPDEKFDNLTPADGRLLASIIKNSHVDQVNWAAVNNDIGTKKRAASERWYALKNRVALLNGVKIGAKANPRRKKQIEAHSDEKDDEQQGEEKDKRTAVGDDDRSLDVGSLSIEDRQKNSKKELGEADVGGISSDSDVDI